MELTREQCTAKYGHVSRRTYLRIAEVYRSGVPELIAAMDAVGSVTINAAAIIAKQPPWRQRAILELPARAKKEEVRQLREEPKAALTVKRRARNAPSLKQVNRELSRPTPRIDGLESVAGSPSDHAEATALIAKWRARLDALYAAIDAAPAAAGDEDWPPPAA